MDLNSVVLIGRLTRDVELKYTPGGMAICNGSVAVGRRVKKGDAYQDETSFFDFACFGKTAENLKPYLTKGKQIAIQGELKQDRWQQDGQNRSRISIMVNSVQLLGGNSEVGKQGTEYKPREQPQQEYQTYTQDGDYFPEDVPF